MGGPIYHYNTRERHFELWLLVACGVLWTATFVGMIGAVVYFAITGQLA